MTSVQWILLVFGLLFASAWLGLQWAEKTTITPEAKRAIERRRKWREKMEKSEDNHER